MVRQGRSHRHRHQWRPRARLWRPIAAGRGAALGQPNLHALDLHLRRGKLLVRRPRDRRAGSAPSALATAGGGALALVNSRHGAEVLAEGTGISWWRGLVTRATLAEGTSGKSCGLGPLTAVGYLAGPSARRWELCQTGRGRSLRPSGPGLAARRPGAAGSLDGGRAEVLAIRSSGGSTLALLAVVSGRAGRPGGRWDW